MINEKESLAPVKRFFSWRPAAWVRVTGADAETFLQGQFTNDLRSLAAGDACYGLWLNHKGRVLADSFVLRSRMAQDEFWVGSYFSTAAVIRERLEAYIIADEVTVEDVTQEWKGITMLGSRDETEQKEIELVGGFVFQGRRSHGPSWEYVMPVDRADEIRARLLVRGRELGTEEMERLRIAATIPAVPRDIGPDELPNEAGLEAVAISYTKGCYLGQEVMARLKSMGQVRRRLMRLKGHGRAPTTPVDLVQGGRKVGQLRSAVNDGTGFVGLALVSLLNLQSDQPLVCATAADRVMTLDEV